MTNSKGIQFIATTIIGGLLFLVPVVFLGFVLAKAVGFMMVIAEPMADFIPVDSVGGVALANLIAITAVMELSERYGYGVDELLATKIPVDPSTDAKPQNATSEGADLRA